MARPGLLAFWLGANQAASYSARRSVSDVHLQLETLTGYSQPRHLLPMKLKPLPDAGLAFLGSTQPHDSLFRLLFLLTTKLDSELLRVPLPRGNPATHLSLSGLILLHLVLSVLTYSPLLAICMGGPCMHWARTLARRCLPSELVASRL